jgi:hypothetical protein
VSCHGADCSERRAVAPHGLHALDDFHFRAIRDQALNFAIEHNVKSKWPAATARDALRC